MTDGLTSKQKAFIAEYLANGFNATQAALTAGYSADTARQQGSRLLTNVYIKAELAARMAELTMSADEVLARLTTMARGDVSVFITADGDVDFTSDAAKANSYLLKKARVKRGVTKSGAAWTEREIELHDPQAALVQIGRHLAMFTDKSETTSDVTLHDWRAGKTAEEIAAVEEAARIVNER